MEPGLDNEPDLSVRTFVAVVTGLRRIEEGRGEGHGVTVVVAIVAAVVIGVVNDEV